MQLIYTCQYSFDHLDILNFVFMNVVILVSSENGTFKYYYITYTQIYIKWQITRQCVFYYTYVRPLSGVDQVCLSIKGVFAMLGTLFSLSLFDSRPKLWKICNPKSLCSLIWKKNRSLEYSAVERTKISCWWTLVKNLILL